jgi:hypothetical protein
MGWVKNLTTAFFSVVLLLSGCANFDASSNRSVFDRTMSLQTYGALEHERPYKLMLRKGTAELQYIGVEHSRDPSGVTVAILRAAFAHYSPTKIYTESPLRPPKPTIDETVSSFGESGVLMHVAHERGIEIASLDLPVRDEMDQIGAKFGRRTAALFYGLRAVLQQEQVSIDFDRESFLEQKVMPWLVLHGALPSALTVDAFLEPLPKLVANSATIGSATLEWFDPLRTSNAVVFNEISRYLVDLRDRRMIEKLVMDFRQGHKILAAAGFSHVVMQEPDIRRLIGCPPMRYDKVILRSPSIASCD